MSRNFHDLSVGDIIQFEGTTEQVIICYKHIQRYPNGDPPVYTFVTNFGVFDYSEWEYGNIERLRDFTIIGRSESSTGQLPDKFYR